MYRCVAPGCKFSKKYPERCKALESGLVFHTFPKQDTFRELWLNQIGNPDIKSFNTSRICSCHFTPDNFTPYPLVYISQTPIPRKLKPDAIPTHFGEDSFKLVLKNGDIIETEPELLNDLKQKYRARTNSEEDSCEIILENRKIIDPEIEIIKETVKSKRKVRTRSIGFQPIKIPGCTKNKSTQTPPPRPKVSAQTQILSVYFRKEKACQGRLLKCLKHQLEAQLKL